MKNEMVLDGYGVQSLTFEEEKEIDGGVIPLIAIGVCWGVMAVCSAVALGMRSAAKDNGLKVW